MEPHLSYAQRASRCSCLSQKRLNRIADALRFSEDFPDGAFCAYMEECGIDISELEPFSEGHNCHAIAKAEGK